MRFLKTNTATRVTVGPFLDKTTGVDPEVALGVTACKLTLMVDDAGVPTLVLDTNPTASGGANDMVHVTGDDAGFYDLELAAANVNYVGRAMLALTDAANHCPVFHEFMILSAQAYDAMCGAGNFKVDVDTIKTQAVTCGAGVTVGAYVGQGTGAIGVNASGHVSRITLTDTLTTYTGNTPQTGDSFARIGALGAGLTAIPTYGDFTTAQKTSLNAATPASIPGAVGSVTGNVGGSVASVTGAVGSVTGNVGGNVVGSVGSVTGAVGSVTGNVGGNVTGSVGSLATQAKTDVNDQVVDVLGTDANTELATIPTTTSDLRKMIQFLFQYFRNKKTVTGTTETLFKEDATTLGTATISDDGNTFIKGEMN